MTLHEVQVYLDREGASDLVAELVMKSPSSPNVFMEAVQLGIALLEGGNPVIQRSLFTKLQAAETSAIFFKVFHDKVRESQAEIRSTMSVNTTEMATSGDKDNDNMKLKRHTTRANGVSPMGMDPFSDDYGSGYGSPTRGKPTTRFSILKLSINLFIKIQALVWTIRRPRRCPPLVPRWKTW